MVQKMIQMQVVLYSIRLRLTQTITFLKDSD